MRRACGCSKSRSRPASSWRWRGRWSREPPAKAPRAARPELPRSASVDDLEDLKEQNAMLNEQIKLLVKTEKRLYKTQRQVEVQLGRIHALNDFALRASAGRTDFEIIAQAFDLL